MGGTVAVTVRMEDGTEYRMRRWTNALPWFYNNVKLFEKDPAHIEEYLSQWRLMKADWEENHTTGKFIHNMTGCYGPYPAPLAPVDYGIVVFDFMKNAIVNCQGYTGFENAAAAFPRFDQERVQAQIELFKAGRILKVLEWGKDGVKELTLPSSADEFEKEYLSKDRRQFDFLHFKYDTSPFTIHQFPDCVSGWKKSKQVILDLGFKLTDVDDLFWDKHLELHEDVEE